MSSEVLIRKAQISDWEEAMTLIWKTFLKFEAEDYGPQGIENFRNFISDAMLRRMFIIGEYHMFVAICDEKIVGVISLRDESHISLLFVEETYHRQGIGRRLIDTIGSFSQEEYGKKEITVHAAPYGVEFYEKLGFYKISPLMCSDGIKYTSMKKELGEENGKII